MHTQIREKTLLSGLAKEEGERFVAIMDFNTENKFDKIVSVDAQRSRQQYFSQVE